MFKYAQIGEDGVVHSVCSLSGEVDDSNAIRIDAYDETLVGKRYNRETNQFEDVTNAD